ncbi:aminopeptidase N, putative [Eimeria mitis]|uniref:Aminopeptidase N, putative n=1 Tax=Eimeria mitis TaxID=44415 RepID=U6K654_9EIME|nr:aminopeptidase N, putative [Eimeria mitis]CDJ31687.1 aminopeptidase N, putative [Eimeria mitis]
MHLRLLGAVVSLGAGVGHSLPGVYGDAPALHAPPPLISSLFSPAAASWRQTSPSKEYDAPEAASFWDFALQQLPHLTGASAAPAQSSARALQDTSSANPEQPLKQLANKRTPEFHRSLYEAPAFEIDAVELTFKLDEDETEVISRLRVRRREGTEPQDLILDGEELQLNSIALNDVRLVEDNETGYSFVNGGSLRLPMNILPQQEGRRFFLEISVTISPKKNLQLSGLYWSNGTLVTQCEAEGYRRITYGLDRPDALSRYLVRLEADQKKYPVLLSNGNKLAEGPVRDNPDRHFAIFEDPFPKPTYLFAIVAGQFGSTEGEFQTASGRKVSLQLYSPPEDAGYLEFAKVFLRLSMQWDEEAFGREYDLDTLNVVCVNDFNSGAMENKGLLIFNCHSLDWTELWLKEGLTTFRERLFSTTLAPAAVHRIEDMKRLINLQFPEDSGALATPVRPESYLAVHNLYNRTTYWKGAEVMRM